MPRTRCVNPVWLAWVTVLQGGEHGTDEQWPRVVAWTGAAVFAGSLLFFLYSYLVTFGAVVIGPLRTGDVIVNVGLLTAFAFHHSVFARAPVRARVGGAARRAMLTGTTAAGTRASLDRTMFRRNDARTPECATAGPPRNRAAV